MKKHGRKEIFNNSLTRALNKRFGFPEDYTGKIEGFEETVPLACKVFNSKHVEEIK